ncbi:13330_t:CDS:2 [Gigaspora margarita]|uniref:13330_t:CDS:1 n=1 Tax=Gigaspora margarita TaxID=4874 RepID=A0ABN7W1B2_GIGMA|nr:13330_t:CDS:2 [Gigaspora margarita]
MKEIGEENSNYPMDRTIKWKSPRRSFQYYIVKEGIYPPKSYRAYTRAPNCYPIPDNYVIETTYGKKEKTITCYIDYYNEKPQYTIKFGLNKDEFRPKTKINGVYLFGLQLSQIKLVRDNRKKPRIIKPFSEITNQMQTIRCRSFSTSSLASIEDQIKQHFSAEDEVAINELTLTVNNSKYRIIYQSKNDDEINRQLAIVRALDYNRISRSSYRALAAICQDLPRDRVF